MIEENAHHYLDCLDCKRRLADVVVTCPQEITFNYVALCPYCNGESQTQTIKGLVHLGSVPGTRMKNWDSNDNRVIIHLVKE